MKKIKKNLAKVEDYDRPYGNSIIGGFTLHLYCANPCDMHQIPKREFVGKTKSITFNMARTAGWIISEMKQLAVCPNCVAAGRITGNKEVEGIKEAQGL